MGFWVLIVVFAGTGATVTPITSSTINFKSREDCERASKEIRAAFTSYRVSTLCFERQRA